MGVDLCAHESIHCILGQLSSRTEPSLSCLYFCLNCAGRFVSDLKILFLFAYSNTEEWEVTKTSHFIVWFGNWSQN